MLDRHFCMERKVLMNLIMFFLILGCSRDKNTIELEKATLGVETSLLSSAVWVAENRGYFADEGLDLTIKEFDSGRLSFLNMLDGGVDISTVAPTPIMFKSFERTDFSIFSTFVYSDTDLKVVVNKDSGISNAENLKGKKVGTPAGTTGQFFLEAFLVYNGLSGSDIKVVDIQPSVLPEALQNGDVDAIVIWEPHAYNARQYLGERALVLPSSEVYRETFNFMVMKDFIKNNPTVIKKFLRAIDKATTFIETNKDDAQNIVAERLNLNKEVLVTLWADFIFRIYLDQSLITTLEDEASWAIKNRLTDETKIPNYLNYFYIDALMEVKSEAVTIIK